MNKGWLRILLASGAFGAAAALFEPWLAPLAVAVSVLALSPLARPRRIWFVGDVESEYAIVSRRREEALRALKDLEDDRLAGKVSAADSERQRPALLAHAKEVTAQLDAVTAKRAAARARIEAALGEDGKA